MKKIGSIPRPSPSAAKFALVFLLLSAISIPAWAGTVNVTLSPDSQTLPISISASLTGQFENTLAGYTGTVEIQFEVLSGPDSGLTGLGNPASYTFTNSDLDVVHTALFSYMNEGTAGTDMVEAILTDAVAGQSYTSAPVSVAWGVSGVPEPSSLAQLAMGLIALFILTRKRFLPSLWG
jgi:hypothetical protein